MHTKETLNDFSKFIKGKESDKTPVVVWGTGPPLTRLVGVKEIDYYLKPGVKLKTQLAFQDNFPEIISAPGIYADFGSAVEPSAFGCPVVWFDNQPPYVKPAINSISEIFNLKIPDPEKDGLMPKALKEYEYMWGHIEKGYVENYGNLDGLGYSLGPVETSALIMGYDKFLIGLYDNPKATHLLLEMATETIIRWLRAQEKINGRLKRLYIPDHMPTQMSKNHFEKFFFPYLKKIYDEFPEALKLYHNEGNVSHVLAEIPAMGADIFHFGITIKSNTTSPSLNDLEVAKKTIGNKICLMGNLDAVKELRSLSPDRVLEICKSRLKVGAPGGRYFLSSAGGMAPGTPPENIKAMIKSVHEK